MGVIPLEKDKVTERDKESPVKNSYPRVTVHMLKDVPS